MPRVRTIKARTSLPIFFCFVILFHAGLICCELTAQTPQSIRYALTGPRDKDEFFPVPTDGGIKEEVPAKCQKRYLRWKNEILSSDFGNILWTRYALNKHFVLRIVISDKNGRGASTDNFLWDRSGKLVGATITIGSDLDKGYPQAIYYPVLNSLELEPPAEPIRGDILAAAKIVHEIGHVHQAACMDMALLKLQRKLFPIYVARFETNGFNTKDSKLIELAEQMGGTPIELWESREYKSEVYALQFIQSRLSGEKKYCDIVKAANINIVTHTRSYTPFFSEALRSAQKPCSDQRPDSAP